MNIASKENYKNDYIYYQWWCLTGNQYKRPGTWAIDIDQVALGKDGLPFAFFELKMMRYKSGIVKFADKIFEERKKQFRVYNWISEKTGVPAYMVLFNRELDYFVVINTKTLNKKIFKSQRTYLEWINTIKLRKGYI